MKCLFIPLKSFLRLNLFHTGSGIDFNLNHKHFSSLIVLNYLKRNNRKTVLSMMMVELTATVSYFLPSLIEADLNAALLLDNCWCYEVNHWQLQQILGKCVTTSSVSSTVHYSTMFYSSFIYQNFTTTYCCIVYFTLNIVVLSFEEMKFSRMYLWRQRQKRILLQHVKCS